MPIHEAVRRILIGRWYAVLIPVVLCVGGVAGLQLVRTQPAYEATARIQASATPPSSTVEADSVLSRVTGVATSDGVVVGAMHDAGVTDRSPAEVARTAVTVTRIGSSAVFDLSVRDPDPRVARALTKALADRVVQFLSGTGGGQIAVLSDTLQHKLDTARTQRAEKAAELGKAHSPVATADLESAVASLDQQIATLNARLGNLDIARATASSATMISEPGPSQAVPRHLRTDLVLAFCLGLALGLLLAALLELLDPRAADGEAAAERLGAPLLGPLRRPSGDGPGDVVPATTLLALRRGLARSGARTLVVTGSRAGEELSGLRRELAGALSRSVQVAAAPPAPSEPEASSREQVRPLNGTARTAIAVRTSSKGQTGTDAVAVDVVGLAEADQDIADAALVYVARPLTPYRDLAELKNLATATGWPVLGVLEEGRRPTGGQPR
jgi:capsular polysaccharide biosynthesis protein